MVQPNGRYAIIHRLEKTVINPVVLWILRSSAHHLLSQWLLIITYEGRQSGREFSTPVLYREDDNKLILLTPKEQTNWLKNFRGGHLLSIHIHGKTVTGTAKVDADEESSFESLQWASTPLRALNKLIPGLIIINENDLRKKADVFVTVYIMVESK